VSEFISKRFESPCLFNCPVRIELKIPEALLQKLASEFPEKSLPIQIWYKTKQIKFGPADKTINFQIKIGIRIDLNGRKSEIFKSFVLHRSSVEV